MDIPNKVTKQEDETKPLWTYVSKLRKLRVEKII